MSDTETDDTNDVLEKSSSRRKRQMVTSNNDTCHKIDPTQKKFKTDKATIIEDDLRATDHSTEEFTIFISALTNIHA